jgi:hypothetical protein
MRYKQPIQDKLDHLENMLIGFGSRFTDPKFNVIVAKDLLDIMKEKLNEIRSLVNAEQD